jgi:hypothetical protein
VINETRTVSLPECTLIVDPLTVTESTFPTETHPADSALGRKMIPKRMAAGLLMIVPVRMEMGGTV